MRNAWRLGCLFALWTACRAPAVGPMDGAVDAGVDATVSPDADPCARMFGLPNARTGLSAEQCAPTCACRAVPFTPPVYDPAFVRSLVEDWRLESPLAEVTQDPYAGPSPAEDPPDTVCAVMPLLPTDAGPRTYRLQTFGSQAEAERAGGHVTHFGRCGVCSTLADLAVYVREPDLTGPVRACGLSSVGNPDAGDGLLACLERLGFQRPCAQIWKWNTLHTRDVCLDVCLTELSRPYHRPDGTLNPCIACDEVRSGPVFKAVAGRTRRNSGLPNALCRPCSEVRALVHRY